MSCNAVRMDGARKAQKRARARDDDEEEETGDGHAAGQRRLDTAPGPRGRADRVALGERYVGFGLRTSPAAEREVATSAEPERDVATPADSVQPEREVARGGAGGPTGPQVGRHNNGTDPDDTIFGDESTDDEKSSDDEESERSDDEDSEDSDGESSESSDDESSDESSDDEESASDHATDIVEAVDEGGHATDVVEAVERVTDALALAREGRASGDAMLRRAVRSLEAPLAEYAPLAEAPVNPNIDEDDGSDDPFARLVLSAPRVRGVPVFNASTRDLRGFLSRDLHRTSRQEGKRGGHKRRAVWPALEATRKSADRAKAIVTSIRRGLRDLANRQGRGRRLG